MGIFNLGGMIFLEDSITSRGWGMPFLMGIYSKILLE